MESHPVSSAGLDAETLFDRVASGEATASEHAGYSVWAEKEPIAARDLADVRRAVKAELNTVPDYSPEMAQAFAQRARMDVQGTMKRVRDRRGWPARSRAGQYVLRIGAALCIGLMAWIGLTGRTPTNTAAVQTYSTRIGERATVTLRDGTKVILAPATTLRYRDRVAELDGEAYFGVTQSEAAPFQVRANGTITRVLGTEFGVMAYRDDAVVRVAVASGRVAVAQNTKSATVVSRGDVAVVGRDGVPVMHRANPDDVLGWTEGRLQFTDEPFESAIPVLERWYGLHLSADRAVANRRLHASLQMGDAREMLDLLSSALNARYVRTGNAVRFVAR